MDGNSSRYVNPTRSKHGKRAAERFRERTNSGDSDGTGETGSTDRTVAGGNGEPSTATESTGEQSIRTEDSESGNESSGVEYTISHSRSSVGGNGRRGNDGRDSDRSTGDSRTRTTEGAITFTPSNIREGKKLNFDSIFEDTPKKRRGRKPKNTATEIPGLADGFQFIYSLPTIFLGDKHEHWNLSQLQADELSKAFVKAVGSSENKNFVKLLKLLEKYIPVFMLISCVYIITSPRIKESLRIINESERTKKRILKPVDGTFGQGATTGTDEVTRREGNQ